MQFYDPVGLDLNLWIEKFIAGLTDRDFVATKSSC
jgi:hypothetical protein